MPASSASRKTVVAGFAGQRQIEVGAEAGALAALVGMAPEERIEARRVGMERHRQHVGARVEDALRAIAVMQVDVEDRHARALLAQALRGDRRIVEEAEAAGDVGEGVMPGRAAKRVSRRLAGRAPHRPPRPQTQALQQALSKVSAEIGQAVSAMW